MRVRLWGGFVTRRFGNKSQLRKEIAEKRKEKENENKNAGEEKEERINESKEGKK